MIWENEAVRIKRNLEIGLMLMNKPQKVKQPSAYSCSGKRKGALGLHERPRLYGMGGDTDPDLIHATIKASAGQGLSVERKRKDREMQLMKCCLGQ